MAEFINSPTMTVGMRADITAAGNIAQSGDTAKGSKQINIVGIKKNATLAESEKVFEKFVGTIGGGSYDSLSAVRTIKEGVA